MRELSNTYKLLKKLESSLQHILKVMKKGSAIYR